MKRTREWRGRGVVGLGWIVALGIAQVAAAPPQYPQEPAHLFRHLCAACHGVTGAGDGPNAEYLDPPPADLTDQEYMETATEEDLLTVIGGGGTALGITPLMPPWGKTLSQAQVAGLVAYVRSLYGAGPPPVPVEERAPEPEVAGRFQGAQCRTCHVRPELRPIAPDLTLAGNKLRREWLYQFLQNPPRIRPVGFIPLTKARMPNFQLTDGEALALTEYLMTQQDPRFSTAAVGELGVDEEAIAQGQELYIEAYACDGCHQLGEEGGRVGPDLTQAGARLQPGWIFRWLKHPEAIRPDSPMPNFGLTDEEVKSLMAYILSKEPPSLSSLPASTVPKADLVKAGEALLTAKNCLGCHTMEPVTVTGRRSKP